MNENYNLVLNILNKNYILKLNNINYYVSKIKYFLFIYLIYFNIIENDIKKIENYEYK